MDGFEFIVLVISATISLFAAFHWYRPLFCVWPGGRALRQRTILGLLPAVALFAILLTLRKLASFDVVDNPVYIVFYLVLGLAWLSLGVVLVTTFFDLSWSYDIVLLGNTSALWAFSGCFLGLTVMYAASNIGDGPGWWCVAFTGGLGLIAFFVLGRIVHAVTGVFERVTVERDLACGFRLGCYLLALGIILGRAEAGDWISFSATFDDFIATGWPALPLTLLMIFGEWIFIPWAREDYSEDARFVASVILGLLFIVLAIVIVVMLPLPAGNPMYGNPALKTP